MRHSTYTAYLVVLNIVHLKIIVSQYTKEKLLIYSFRTYRQATFNRDYYLHYYFIYMYV
jgi:hypothetical protein